MNYFFLVFGIMFFFMGCNHITVHKVQIEEHKSRSISSIDQIDDDQVDYFINTNVTKINIEQYQNLVEETLVWRSKAIAFFNFIEKLDVYSNSDLRILHEQGTEDYIKLRERLNIHISEVKWLTSRQITLKLTNGKTRYRPAKWFKGEFKKIHFINPEDEVGQFYIEKIKLGLASALLLYDNYLLAIAQYQKYKKTRMLLNYDNIEYPAYLQEITDKFNSSRNFERLQKAIKIFISIRKYEQKNSLLLSGEHKYLNDLIEHSYFYLKNHSFSYWDKLVSKLRGYKSIIYDRFMNIKNQTLNEVSKVFGNSVGMVSFRDGKMKYLNSEKILNIKQNLEPLDILLEKTPFRLTDHFIPGHWGHVAIWVGTQEDLELLGVWELLPGLYDEAKDLYGYNGPSFQQLVKDGHNIIEALRPGVQINTFQHFLNIDDFAVIRLKELDLNSKINFLIRAFEQIGKEYDFNFDVETDKKIVCSELAYVTFNDGRINWPVEKQLGRRTISPDNVASKAVNNGAFYPIILFYQGKEIIDNIEENFNHLLMENYNLIK